MKILGFGDSFITDNDLSYTYTSITRYHFNAELNLYGKAGSGSWDAFFSFLDRNETCDVLMFVWSAEHRTYHPHYSNICPSTIEQNLDTAPIWEAVKQYYTYLYDCRKAYYEHVSFYNWVDQYLHDNHSNTKVIHLWGFPAGNIYTNNGQYIPQEPYTWDEKDKYNYLYRFKHGTEIRPALINLSYRDGWPVDLSKETRCHHMTPSMHEYLSKYVIDAIENYEPGRLVEIP